MSMLPSSSALCTDVLDDALTPAQWQLLWRVVRREIEHECRLTLGFQSLTHFAKHMFDCAQRSHDARQRAFARLHYNALAVLCGYRELRRGRADLLDAQTTFFVLLSHSLRLRALVSGQLCVDEQVARRAADNNMPLHQCVMLFAQLGALSEQLATEELCAQQYVQRVRYALHMGVDRELTAQRRHLLEWHSSASASASNDDDSSALTTNLPIDVRDETHTR